MTSSFHPLFASSGELSLLVVALLLVRVAMPPMDMESTGPRLAAINLSTPKAPRTSTCLEAKQQALYAATTPWWPFCLVFLRLGAHRLQVARLQVAGPVVASFLSFFCSFLSRARVHLVFEIMVVRR